MSAILIKTRPPIGVAFVYFAGTSNGAPAIARTVSPRRVGFSFDVRVVVVVVAGVNAAAKVVVVIFSPKEKAYYNNNVNEVKCG